MLKALKVRGFKSLDDVTLNFPRLTVLFGAFSFPSGGLAELLSGPPRKFDLEADLEVGPDPFRYKVSVEIEPLSAALSVVDEYLARLHKSSNDPVGVAAIEVVEGRIRLRRKSSGKPRFESLRQNVTMLSDVRLGAPEYRATGPSLRQFVSDAVSAFRLAMP
jgi:hypothetical protein